MLQPRTLTPTADQLCSEAYALIAGQAPSAEQLDRAVKFWMEEALLDIWQFATHQDITRFKILENSATLVLTKGKRRYAWPEDYHRPIAVTLLQGKKSGTVAGDAESRFLGTGKFASAADGGLELVVTASGDFDDYDITAPTNYDLSGRYLVVMDGPAAGTMREILSSMDYLSTPSTTGIDTWVIATDYVVGDLVKYSSVVYRCTTLNTSDVSNWPGAGADWEDFWEIPGPSYVHVLTIDDEWTTPEIPEAGDTFIVATERGVWIDEEMQESMDEISSRSGLGLPISFNDFDNTLELDVAPDGTEYALLLRYWSNPVKVNKESEVMQRILTDWRIPLSRYIEWKTAKEGDDSRALALKKEYEDARLALMEHEYDRGPRFEGFWPSR